VAGGSRESLLALADLALDTESETVIGAQHGARAGVVASSADGARRNGGPAADPKEIDEVVTIAALLRLGWLPPPDTARRLAAALGDGGPSSDEDRTAIRAIGVRISQDHGATHRRPERPGQRNGEVPSEGERSTQQWRVVHDRHGQASANGSRNGHADHLNAEIRALADTIETRANVYRAVGVVMAHGRCTQDEAWSALRTLSQHTNRKVRDVAAALTSHVASGRPLPRDLRAVLEPPTA
jgi:ANTAR domain